MTHLEAVVRPAAELHDTGLLVEGKVLHVHLTGAVVDGGGFPLHQTIVKQSGFGSQGHLEVAVSAEHLEMILLSVISSEATVQTLLGRLGACGRSKHCQQKEFLLTCCKVQCREAIYELKAHGDCKHLTTTRRIKTVNMNHAIKNFS